MTLYLAAPYSANEEANINIIIKGLKIYGIDKRVNIIINANISTNPPERANNVPLPMAKL